MYHEGFASLGLLEAYDSKARKRFTDTGKNLTNLPTFDEQDALMAEEGEVVAVEAVVAAVPAVNNDAFLDVNKDDD